MTPIQKILLIGAIFWGIIIIRWIALFILKRYFPKKWTYLQARKKTKFSSSLKLFSYAKAKGWKMDYYTQWERFLKWVKLKMD